ncbi:MAG: MFS transporter [Pelistega sp.]|nr:MFS transporter [Pelistega sp.]
MQNVHHKPWLMLVTLYMSQYVGISFLLAASVVVLRGLGLPLEQLALINLVMLPLAGKIVLALLVDYLPTCFKGHYRGWLIIAQLSMTVLLVIISFVHIVEQFYLVLALFLIYSVMTCLQDVSVDGLACKIFAEGERQNANAIQYASNLVGNIIGGGVVLIFYEQLQWQGAVIILALLTALSLIQVLFYKEPILVHALSGKEVLLESKQGLIKQIFFFCKVHKAWFLFLLILPIGFSSAYVLINPMLVDLGWSIQEIGFVTKIYGSIIGVVSAMLILLLIKRFGRNRTVQLLITLQALALIFLLPLTTGSASVADVYIAIGLYSLINPALLAAISTVIMDKASTMRAKATFFSLQLSFVVVMGFVYSVIALTLASSYGYYTVLIIYIILAILVAVLSCAGLLTNKSGNEAES